MLKSLTIKNIAVIETAEPIFNTGLNILTGETGAGKSIIIDSINAILGERTSRELIRNGCEKAVITAVFTDVSKKCAEVFGEYDIFDDDGDYIIQRTLLKSGKTNCRINGMPVNTAVLKEISKYLVNIHGQHDNQMLLRAENHIGFLDAFAKNEALVADYKASFDEFRAVRKKLNTALAAVKKQTEESDLLNYQINELETANITEGEVSALREKTAMLEKAEKLTNILLPLGTDNAESVSPVEKLAEISADIVRLGGVSIEVSALSERLSAAVIELQDISQTAQNILADLNFEPQELENMQNRLDFLYGLMRKYNVEETGLAVLLDEFRNKRDGYEQNSGSIAEYEKRLLALQGELIEKAQRLTDSRNAAAKILSEKICAVLSFLDMADVSFGVDIQKTSYTATGADSVEFLISANKGQRLMPLAKVASGGELSRVMLAIKSVLADTDSVDTMIFDEIDTGISGRAARKIGIQLSRVARGRQVLCITHLAQIAALADTHLLISKATTPDGVFTTTAMLDKEQHIAEVARLMSGGDMTASLHETAVELIESQRVAAENDFNI